MSSSDSSPTAAYCDQCDNEVPHGARFCPSCGQATQAQLSPQPHGRAAAISPQRTTVGAGRYHVRELIGEGTRKRVYRGEDTLLGRAVAIATIKTEGLDEGALERIHREAQAMARLGAHPHVVTIHDMGEEDGTPYLVQELIEGGSVDQLLQTSSLALGDALRIANDICHALEYAHARGVVHRDLKPSNIFLTSDGTAKLGDFGLAQSAADARMTSNGAIVGTAAYMAPEQALGHADARADLYALGAVLYEMVTGRPPFLGDDPVAVIGQHLQAAPVTPSLHNAAVPPVLDELILRLLAKSPAERPADAMTVRAALAASAHAAASTSAHAPPHDMPSNLDALAGQVFVGRERETQTLRAALADALAGMGRLVTLVGEPGIGKTRMAEELATYARLRGAEVLVGRCHEGEGAPAYWPWMQIVRSYVQAREPAAWLADMGPGAADIADMVPELRQRASDLPFAPALDLEQARFRLFDSLSAFFKGAAQSRPLMLVLDDLHWADKPSLLLLQFLTRDLASLRLLVVATYRDVELGRHHPLEETLAELARNSRSERILLRGLQEADVARFIELTAGTPSPAVLTQAIYRETEGNPFFMQEVVRLLHSDGRLRHADSIATWSIEIPQSVRSVIGQRLRRLSEACNQVLTLAAAVGREFDAKFVDALAADREHSSSLDRLLEQLDEAVRARILNEVPEVPGRYRFAHALVRETLYDELRTAQRVRLHRSIGETLERFHAGSIEAHLSELAHHFGEAAAGGGLQKAVDYAIRAAERADQLLAFEAAAQQYQRALQLLELAEAPNERQRCTILVALGEAQLRSGDTAQAIATSQSAIPLARELGDAILLGRAALGACPSVSFDQAVAEERGRVLEEAANRLGDGDDVLKTQLLRALSMARFWFESDAKRAERAERILQLARRSGDPVAMADAVSTAQYSSNSAGVRWSQLRALAVDTVRAAEALGQEEGVFRARIVLYIGHVNAGDGLAAERELERLDALAQRLRIRAFGSTVEAMKCQQALWKGHLPEAERHMQAAFELYPGSRTESVFQVYATQMGALRRVQGRLAEIERSTRRGVEIFPWVVGYRVHLMCYLAETGREAEAREGFTRLAEAGFTELRRDGNYVMNLALLSDTCLLVGDASAASTLYDLIRPHEGACLVFGQATTCGAAARHLGNLAAIMERFDDATRHFEDALAFERQMGAHVWLARAQIDYARMCIQRGAAGDSEHALRLLNEALTTSQELGLGGWVNLALPLKLRAQGIELRDARSSIDIVAASVEARRPDLQRCADAAGRVTLMFSDMEGFTEMTERLGDQEAHKVIRAHNAIIREQVRTHSGTELELQGDGFLLAFADPLAAVRCAVAIQRAFAAYSAEHVEQPIRVRIGLHIGEAIREADGFFGKTVILAARIAAQARGTEVLVSSPLRELVSGSEIRFDESREVTLKGLAGTYTLHLLAWTA